MTTLTQQRIIHLTEISAVDVPATDRYKYKCRVQIEPQNDEPIRQQDLLGRMQPTWLLCRKSSVGA